MFVPLGEPHSDRLRIALSVTLTPLETLPADLGIEADL
jgi:hypothetical protein